MLSEGWEGPGLIAGTLCKVGVGLGVETQGDSQAWGLSDCSFDN